VSEPALLSQTPSSSSSSSSSSPLLLLPIWSVSGMSRGVLLSTVLVLTILLSWCCPQFVLGQTYGDAAITALFASSNAVRPVYALNFTSNPASLTGATLPGYNWALSDPTDNSLVSPYHSGVVILNGSTNSYVDLNSLTTQNSAGSVLPVIGGVANSWTFEVSTKNRTTSTVQSRVQYSTDSHRSAQQCNALQSSSPPSSSSSHLLSLIAVCVLCVCIRLCSSFQLLIFRLVPTHGLRSSVWVMVMVWMISF
jgi:hypothetical protein